MSNRAVATVLMVVGFLFDLIGMVILVWPPRGGRRLAAGPVGFSDRDLAGDPRARLPAPEPAGRPHNAAGTKGPMKVGDILGF